MHYRHITWAEFIASPCKVFAVGTCWLITLGVSSLIALEPKIILFMGIMGLLGQMLVLNEYKKTTIEHRFLERI